MQFTTVPTAQLARYASRTAHRVAFDQNEALTLSQRQLKRKYAKRTPAGIRQAVAVFVLVAVALVTGTVMGDGPEAAGAAGGVLTLLGSVVACVLAPR